MNIETYDEPYTFVKDELNGTIVVITGFSFDIKHKEEISNEKIKEEVEKLLPLVIGEMQCIPATEEYLGDISESEYDFSDKNWW